MTFEHVWIYGGSQINERWAIIPLCEYAHSVGKYQDGGIMDKQLNQYISLMIAEPADLKKYPEFDWNQKFVFLRGKYFKQLHGIKFVTRKLLQEKK